jgi:recombination protein RecT
MANDTKIQKLSPSEQKLGELKSLVASMQGEMARAMPRHITADRMARIVLTTLRTDMLKPFGTKLVECDKFSFMGAVMTAASLGLEVNTPLGHAYLIPRKIKGIPTCTLQIGYQGLLQLARNSGQVDSIWGHAVYEGDNFRVKLGLENTIEHEPCGEDDPELMTHVYACARLKGAKDVVFVVLTRSQVERARARGGDRQGSPWDTDYVAMAQKTALRRLCKWLPQSLEMANAVRVDELATGGQRQGSAFASIPAVADTLEHHGLLTQESIEEDEPEERHASKADAVASEILGKPKPSPKNPAPEVDAMTSQANRERMLDLMEAARTEAELRAAGTETGKAVLLESDRDFLRQAYGANLRRIQAPKSSPVASDDEDVAALLGEAGGAS